MPFAPPPLSTSPTFGRASWAAPSAGTPARSTNVVSRKKAFGKRFKKPWAGLFMLVIVSKGQMRDIRDHRWRQIALYAQIGAGWRQAPVIQVFEHGCLRFLVLGQSNANRIQAQAGARKNVIDLLAGNG